MSQTHDGQWTFRQFGNPLRGIFSKKPYLSPELLSLLHVFEQNLAESLRKLMALDNKDVLSLSWMRVAMETLCTIHDSIKTLITDLKFPSSDWDNKWIDMYLDDSVKLLDICIALISEISRLDQCQLLLQYSLHLLDPANNYPPEKAKKAHTCLQDWMQKIRSRSPKLEACPTTLQVLKGTLYLGKVENSAKGEILGRAMYGLKVVTVFICSLLVAAFHGRSKPLLLDLDVPDKFSWAVSFTDLQAYVNNEILNLFPSGKIASPGEVEAVRIAVEKFTILNFVNCNEDAPALAPATGRYSTQEGEQGLQESVSKLTKSADELDRGYHCR
ncbi:hypothetical protein DsansV1_C08g0081001 [Dioscorea sansibarensis]